MNDFAEHLICRHTFNAQNLIESYPPKLRNANKKVVYQIACPPNSIYSGELVFSRWRTVPLIYPSLTYNPEIVEQKGYFEYTEGDRTSERVEWYLNFAHSDLFCAYGERVFAQDEMQVAEHPALASLREALLSLKIAPFTVENGEPTPILIRNVERRCAIATNPDPALGIPLGLYGNNFAKATTAAIILATKPLNPPTFTNIIAMEAPSGGYNFYEYEIIEYILATAFTGFSAAKVESQLQITAPIIIIHTGFGAAVLMAAIES